MEHKYINVGDMQKKADEAFQSKVDASKERQRKIDEQAKKKQEEYNKLFQMAFQSEREDNKKKRDKEIEAERAKAMKEVEEKFESKGIKSEYTKKLDEGYKGLLSNIRGLDD